MNTYDFVHYRSVTNYDFACYQSLKKIGSFSVFSVHWATLPLLSNNSHMHTNPYHMCYNPDQSACVDIYVAF